MTYILFVFAFSAKKNPQRRMFLYLPQKKTPPTFTPHPYRVYIVGCTILFYGKCQYEKFVQPCIFLGSKREYEK